MDNCSIGENIKIIYPTPLKLCNIKNDNIDVFVKLENKKE